MAEVPVVDDDHTVASVLMSYLERARRATKDGAELVLTIRELDLLAILMANPGQAFKRSQLMREEWGWTFGDQSTVTVHVRRLREKVGDDPTNPTLIQTVWGIGYRLDVPSVAGPPPTGPDACTSPRATRSPRCCGAR